MHSRNYLCHGIHYLNQERHLQHLDQDQHCPSRGRLKDPQVRFVNKQLFVSLADSNVLCPALRKHLSLI